MVWMDKDSPDGVSRENYAMQLALNRVGSKALPGAVPEEGTPRDDVLAQQRVASDQAGKALRNSDT